MKLWAIADLHLRYEVNRRALQALAPRPGDWLILAGDVGETEEQLAFALEVLAPRFARLLWVPGNHDLWTLPVRSGGDGLRGEAKYLRLVALCRAYGAATPEDPYLEWPGEGGPCLIAPLFLLYDYTFRPDHVPLADAVRWAAEENVVCSDEVLLDPEPYPSRAAWCAARCAEAEPRLAAAAERAPLVLVNHWPLRRDLAVLPRVPRFTLWCGTRTTEEWHRRFRAEVVVYGHLHIRATQWRDGVRCEEVSLGYPQNWEPRRGLAPYLREILPGISRNGD